MKKLLTLLSLVLVFTANAGGDYLITKDGQKIEAWRMRVNKNSFQVKFKDRTTKVFSSSEVSSYFNSEEDKYYERLDLNEKSMFLHVLVSDGLHKIVSHVQKIEYGGGVLGFEDLYYFDGQECKGTFTKENQIRVLRKFDLCPAFQDYVNSKRKWYRRLNKLDDFLKSKCQGAY